MNRLALRGVILSSFHISIWSCMLALAYGFRFDFEFNQMQGSEPHVVALALFLILRSVAFFYWSLERVSWRYVSTPDIVKIVKVHVASTVALAALLALLRVPNFPRSVIFMELVLSVVASAGAKLSVRLGLEALQSRKNKSDLSSNRSVLILGAGESGHLLIKTLLAHRQFQFIPMGILDDNPHLRGSTVCGVSIIGRLSDLRDLLESNPNIAAAMLAIPSLSQERVREIESTCNSLNVPLKRIQLFEDIALSNINSGAPSIPSVESVLEREVGVSNEREIREFIQNRRVAVTGAGGSIGSELARQLLRFSPENLLFIDNNEFHMFKLQRELASASSRVNQAFCIASVVDQPRLQALFERYRPDIVFHAAAFKHVPLMEDNPYEALKNNVIGTRNLLRACLLGEIEHFVFVSSDKAVNSCNVMGHSKRIGELLVQHFTALAKKQGREFKSSIVRFGNVINSNGSVVPLFKEQILSGGPVTITHPDMHRYFMSIREAVRLILAAGSIGESGEIFLLDMGNPVRIEDVARKMLALYGRLDIPIVYSGVRPGERLFESLLGEGETLQPTILRKVSRVHISTECGIGIADWLNDIESRLANLSSQDIRGLLREACGSELAQPANGPITAHT